MRPSQLALERRDVELGIGSRHIQKRLGSSIIGEKPCKCEFSAREGEEMFYAAGARRSQFLRGLAWPRSSPLTSIANSSGRITTLRAPLSGQPKRPLSSRFAHTHNP